MAQFVEKQILFSLENSASLKALGSGDASVKDCQVEEKNLVKWFSQYMLSVYSTVDNTKYSIASWQSWYSGR